MCNNYDIVVGSAPTLAKNSTCAFSRGIDFFIQIYNPAQGNLNYSYRFFCDYTCTNCNVTGTTIIGECAKIQDGLFIRSFQVHPGKAKAEIYEGRELINNVCSFMVYNEINQNKKNKNQF